MLAEDPDPVSWRLLANVSATRRVGLALQLAVLDGALLTNARTLAPLALQLVVLDGLTNYQIY